MRFDFELGVTRAEALQVARAALLDDGLTVTGWQAAPRIVLVLVDGVARLIIPSCRIVPAGGS